MAEIAYYADKAQLKAAQAAAAAITTTADDDDKQGSGDTWWLILAWVLFVLWVIGLILMSVNNYFLHMIARNSSTKFGSTPNPGWSEAIDYYEGWTPSQRGRMQTVAAFSNGLWMLPGVNLLLNSWLMAFLAPVHGKVKSDPEGYQFNEAAAKELAARGATPAQIETSEMAASRSKQPPASKRAPSAPAAEPSAPPRYPSGSAPQYGWKIPTDTIVGQPYAA